MISHMSSSPVLLCDLGVTTSGAVLELYVGLLPLHPIHILRKALQENCQKFHGVLLTASHKSPLKTAHYSLKGMGRQGLRAGRGPQPLDELPRGHRQPALHGLGIHHCDVEEVRGVQPGGRLHWQEILSEQARVADRMYRSVHIAGVAKVRQTNSAVRGGLVPLDETQRDILHPLLVERYSETVIPEYLHHSPRRGDTPGLGLQVPVKISLHLHPHGQRVLPHAEGGLAAEGVRVRPRRYQALPNQRPSHGGIILKAQAAKATQAGSGGGLHPLPPPPLRQSLHHQHVPLHQLQVRQRRGPGDLGVRGDPRVLRVEERAVVLLRGCHLLAPQARLLS
mmetsp:Transcript_58157/g.134196  ORF Transcript_58157/g.134196 Transcript_58157/m.134196 type:complete len:337 (-) Transcript_58157:1550-2560(-)